MSLNEPMTDTGNLKWNISKSFVTLLVVYWTVVFLRGYPEPWPDDTFYVGTAVYFSKFGQLWNPMTPGLLDRFTLFPYPPLYSGVLGLWLKGFGISTTSILAFQGILNFICSISITKIMRRFDISYLVISGVILLYTGHVFDLGLRPNSFAYTLMALSTAFFVTEGRWHRLMGWLFLGLSLAALPYLLVFALPLAVGVLYWRYTNERRFERRLIFKEAGIIFVAILVDVLIFGKFIDYRYLEWMKGYLYVASLNATPFSISSCIEGWKLVGCFFMNGWNPILFSPGYILAFMALVLQGIFWKETRFSQRIISMIFVTGMIGAGILYSVFFIQIVPHATLAFSLVMLNMNQKWQEGVYLRKISVIPMLCIPLAISLKLIPFIHQKNYDAEKIEAIRTYVQGHPEKRCIISSDAWRYVFDYRSPEGALAAEWCVPQSDKSWIAHIRTIQSKKEEDLWIMSAYHFQQFIPDSKIKFTPLGVGPITFKSIRMYRDEILLLP